MELRIKSILKQKGMTAKELAEKTGISQTMLSYVMSGTTQPSVKTLEKIAQAMGVHISELFVDAPTIIVCPHCLNAIYIEPNANKLNNTL